MKPGHSTPLAPGGGDGWLPRAEHVWITHLSGLAESKLPGLLLAWRRHPSRAGIWQGWVIYVEAGTRAAGDGPYVRQSWHEHTGIERRGA